MVNFYVFVFEIATMSLSLHSRNWRHFSYSWNMSKTIPTKKNNKHSTEKKKWKWNMFVLFMLKFIDEYMEQFHTWTKRIRRETKRHENTPPNKFLAVKLRVSLCVRKCKEKQNDNQKSSICGTETGASNAVFSVSTSTLKLDAFWRFCFQLQIEVYKHSKM